MPENPSAEATETQAEESSLLQRDKGIARFRSHYFRDSELRGVFPSIFSKRFQQVTRGKIALAQSGFDAPYNPLVALQFLNGGIRGHAI